MHINSKLMVSGWVVPPSFQGLLCNKALCKASVIPSMAHDFPQKPLDLRALWGSLQALSIISSYKAKVRRMREKC